MIRYLKKLDGSTVLQQQVTVHKQTGISIDEVFVDGMDHYETKWVDVETHDEG